MKTETCKQTDKSQQREVLSLVLAGEDGKFRFLKAIYCYFIDGNFLSDFG